MLFLLTAYFFFCSKLEDNAERWYSKLAATKGDWEALRMAFTAAFQMEEVLLQTQYLLLRWDGSSETVALGSLSSKALLMLLVD